MIIFKTLYSGIWSNKSFRKYWIARFFTSLCPQVIAVAIAWQIYDLTRDPIYLGLIGLSQFLPQILLVLITGYVSDTFSRKKISFLGLLIEALLSFSFVVILFIDKENVILYFVPLILLGITRAFIYPAETSLIANIVNAKDFPHAIALSTLSWQTASIFGPVLGGVLYGLSPFSPYIFSVFGTLYASLLIFSTSIIYQKLDKNNFVNLKIQQEISSPGPVIQGTTSFNIRSINTEVVLRDNQVLVMGGLMQKNKSKANSGVPILKDMPVFGRLFRQENESESKTELMVFVTPHIITDFETADNVTDQVKNRLKGLGKQFNLRK